jgi:UDP-glucose 4-epimerase
MNILITGGAGFIGSHLVELLLKKKYNITVLDNLSTGRIENLKFFLSQIKFYKYDLFKENKWKKLLKKQDLVIHLAALADIVPSIKNPKKYFDVNVIGTKNLIEACLENKVKRVIYSASSSCYGIPKNYPTDENENMDPMYPYALTKRLGEELLLHYGKVYKIKVISLRLFNVYGTKSRTSGTYGAMFGVFLKQKISKMPLTVVGDGNQTRDFTYVTDVAEAFFKAMFYQGNYNIFNIGTGNPISINRIVKLLNCNKITIPKRPGEPRITHANVSLAQKELNWQYKIKIEEGIKRILNEINYWKNAPLWTSRKIKQATKEWFKYLK